MFPNPSDNTIPPATAATHALWYALTVRPTAEKSVAAALESGGIRTFSPVYTTKRLWSDRARDIELPLFPGYVFCFLDSATRLTSISVDGVVGLSVSPKKALSVVDQRELESIRLLAQAGIPLTPWPYVNQAATVAVATAGMRGIFGVIIAPGKLVVSLTMLQRSILADLRSHGPIEIATFASNR